MAERATKFIFVTGGVLSSLGKGLASASIGALLEGHGFVVVLAGNYGKAYLVFCLLPALAGLRLLVRQP